MGLTAGAVTVTVDTLLTLVGRQLAPPAAAGAARWDTRKEGEAGWRCPA
jgi:hypothetical protein